jgi:4-alpha-glucanotransferase
MENPATPDAAPTESEATEVASEAPAHPADSSTLKLPEAEAAELAQLQELARSYAIGTSFAGWDGSERTVSAGTLRLLLAALGVEAGSPEATRNALSRHEDDAWRRPLPPVVVLQEGQQPQIPVNAPEGDTVTVRLRAEDGTDLALDATSAETRPIDGMAVTRTAFNLPGGLDLGWHTLHAQVGDAAHECSVVVTPRRLATGPGPGDARSWGLMAQLYSVRSTRSWGLGDYADLADLAAFSGNQLGAGFLLVNPMHATAPLPPVEPSPYLPTTRRFFHPMYLRIEDIPEMGYLPAQDRATVEELAAARQEENSNAELLDRDGTYAAKLEALNLLFRVPLSLARQQQFEAYCAEQGQGLEDFALWCALSEELDPDAPEWEQASHPGTPFAMQQRSRLAERIRFHSWLQWLCDGQLESAQRAAEAAGMPIGVVHDLAVGVQGAGADAWTLQHVLMNGVTVGAPPDMFNQQGQNWAQPPWHPDRLAAAGYVPFRDMLRNILRHAGGIRIDHILGLFRLWCIPAGRDPVEGAYLNYDHEALIGILALEAQRANAVVVGEDLGTFEPWVRDYLAQRGIFGTSILWFERNEGRPLSPEEYRQQCLTSVNTHDLPPTAGYLAHEHVALREKLGLLGRPVEEEREADAEDQEAVLSLVRSRGLLTDEAAAGPDAVQHTVEALYSFVAQTPSSLLGVALVDAVGERRTQNQPGTSDEYPNWRIPLAGPDGKAVRLEDLPGNPRVAALASAVLAPAPNAPESPAPASRA